MRIVFDRQLRIAIRGVMIRRVMTVAFSGQAGGGGGGGGGWRNSKSEGPWQEPEVRSTTGLLRSFRSGKDTRTMPLLHATHVGNFIRARHAIGLLELVSLVVRLAYGKGLP
ncbi:hypothetical protein Tco_0644894 [Tanacetum coccineum]